jgi:hypothetical protein
VALQEQFGVSERRACTVVDQPRSTQRLTPPVPADDDLALRAWLRRRPRWGWRRAAVEAKKAGWRANHKRIHRLWVARKMSPTDYSAARRDGRSHPAWSGLMTRSHPSLGILTAAS